MREVKLLREVKLKETWGKGNMREVKLKRIHEGSETITEIQSTPTPLIYLFVLY
jgi:hypothetical protein